jgi:hypothetical protein
MDKELGSFVWDLEKEAQNIKKHGVNFTVAAGVFRDKKLIIMIDEKHNKDENRLFCFGKVDGKVLTVRFLFRSDKIRIYGAGYWRKGEVIYEEENLR